MAVYSHVGSINDHYTLKLTVSETNVVVANNTSQVVWNAQLVSSGGWDFSLTGSTVTVKINGVTVYNGYAQRSIAAGGTLNIANGTSAAISHKADGSKSVVCSVEWDQSSTANYTPGDTTASGTLALTTIPRASIFTVADANVEADTLISIARASSSFTHTLTYVFGSLSGTIATGVGASQGWTIPATFYAQMPAQLTKTCTITCTTYSGATQIGNPYSKTFNVNINQLNCIPTVSATLADSNAAMKLLTDSDTKLVKGYSNANIVTTASSAYGATIASYLVTCADGKTATAANSTINAVTSASFTVKVTDSRGLSKTIPVTGTLIDYLAPAIVNKSLTRGSPATTLNIAFNGVWFSGTFGSVANYLNTPATHHRVSYKFREVGAASYGAYVDLTPTTGTNTFAKASAAIAGTFAVDKSYDFIFAIKDAVNTTLIESQLIVSKVLPIIDVGEDDVIVNGDLDVTGELANNGTPIIPYVSIYSPTNGILIDTGLLSTNLSKMITIEIIGNGYGSYSPINTIIQAYHYTPSGTWLNYKQTNFGGVIPTAKFLIYGGKIYCHIAATTGNPTFLIKEYIYGAPQAIVVTNAAKPAGTSEVTCSLYGVVKMAEDVDRDGITFSGAWNKGGWNTPTQAPLTQRIDNSTSQHSVIVGEREDTGARLYGLDFYDNYTTQIARLYAGADYLEVAASPKFNGRVIPQVVPLYTSATGSATSVTLAESAGNFDYLEIFYGITTSAYGNGSVKVYAPDGKIADMVLTISSGGYMYMASAKANISGTTITINADTRTRWATAPGITITDDVNILLIKRVDGIRL